MEVEQVVAGLVATHDPQVLDQDPGDWPQEHEKDVVCLKKRRCKVKVNGHNHDMGDVAKHVQTGPCKATVRQCYHPSKTTPTPIMKTILRTERHDQIVTSELVNLPEKEKGDDSQSRGTFKENPVQECP